MKAIKQQDLIDSVADCLGGALIGREKGAAGDLMWCQRIDPLLQLLHDLADCECWFASVDFVHDASLP